MVAKVNTDENQEYAQKYENSRNSNIIVCGKWKYLQFFKNWCFGGEAMLRTTA